MNLHAHLGLDGEFATLRHPSYATCTNGVLDVPNCKDNSRETEVLVSQVYTSVASNMRPKEEFSRKDVLHSPS